MARDLRFLMASHRIAASIERCGDLVASTVRGSGRNQSDLVADDTVRLLANLAAQSEQQFRTAVSAYSLLESGMAGSVAQHHDRVDDLHRSPITQS